MYCVWSCSLFRPDALLPDPCLPMCCVVVNINSHYLLHFEFTFSARVCVPLFCRTHFLHFRFRSEHLLDTCFVSRFGPHTFWTLVFGAHTFWILLVHFLSISAMPRRTMGKHFLNTFWILSGHFGKY